MPSSNLPDPAKIPDMSLGERSEKPTPIQPQPNVASSYQPEAEPAKPKPIAIPPESVGPREWLEGDSVLAPWEPIFLYPGIIKQIKLDEARGDQALIEFDDGGEGWVYVYSLCPLDVKEGQQAHARRNRSNHYSPGEIVAVNGDEVRILFDDGAKEWLSIVSLRIPCIANGPGAVATKTAPWQTPYDAGGAQPPSSGIPSWVWTIGIIILIAVIRGGCRAMQH